MCLGFLVFVKVLTYAYQMPAARWCVVAGLGAGAFGKVPLLFFALGFGVGAFGKAAARLAAWYFANPGGIVPFFVADGFRNRATGRVFRFGFVLALGFFIC